MTEGEILRLLSDRMADSYKNQIDIQISRDTSVIQFDFRY